MFPNRRQKRNAIKAAIESQKVLNARYESWALQQKKFELISSLQSVLLELSKEQANIRLSIDSCIEEHKKQLEEIMREFMKNFKQDPSTELPQFQIEESFKVLLSNSNLKFQKISEKITFIDGLIKKVSPDSQNSSISEQEQFFIDILSAYSFFRSKDVESVQTMINFCLNTRICLDDYLIPYLNEFRRVMRNEIFKQEKQTDFTIDSKALEDQQLEQFLQELSELKEEIEKRKIPFFSITSLAEFIFSINHADFLSISEDTRRLEDTIKKMKKIFCIKKESFVEFVQSCIDRCDTLVRYSHLGDFGGRSDDENSGYEDPVEEHRRNLEESLKQIRRTRV